MSQSNTALVKYIYLDVVGFTYQRPVEAQTEIITILNDIVRQATSALVSEGQVIYIPVGDGICIALISSTHNYDIHIRIAEEIIRRIVSLHNPSAKSNRQFEVRIGINENVDNLITDINGNKNVCGSGVNDAQRIMSFADASQILVGRTTYDSLRPRERYSHAFRAYQALAKHNIPIDLYQYIGGNVAGLNSESPSSFTQSTPPPETKLSTFEAHYIAHALQNTRFIEGNIGPGQNSYALRLLLNYLAIDSINISASSKRRPPSPHMPNTNEGTLQEQFDVFLRLPFWVCVDLSFAVRDQKIQHKECFNDSDECLFPNNRAKEKLKSEWTSIWNLFNLDH